MSDDPEVKLLVSRTLSDLAWDLPIDLVPRVVARRAVEVTLRAVAEDVTTPDDLRQVRARAYADGVLAGRAGITDTRLPGSNDDEEDNRG